MLYHGEAMSKPRGSADVPGLPEEVGEEAALRLLEQIYLVRTLDDYLKKVYDPNGIIHYPSPLSTFHYTMYRLLKYTNMPTGYFSDS